MSDVVLDASALVLAVGSRAGTAAGLRDRLTSSACHAPHLIDAEVGNTLRREVLAGRLAPESAAAGLAGGRLLVDQHYPHTGSLAGAADARLARAPGLPCQVELVA